MLPGGMDAGNHEHRNLPRLDRSYYRGLAHVHWIFNIRDRKTGYLDEPFFQHFKWVGTHALLRYAIVAPCICLMPDHIHLLLVGTDEEGSDQVVATQFLRKHLKGRLRPYEFQRPAYDHVLRERERAREEFRATANYILDNPVRSGLVETAEEWAFRCAIVPGYPDLDLDREDFWDVFWRVYYRQIEGSAK